MQYLMAPLEEHYDDGFGAVGDAFYRAAKALEKENKGLRFAWNHLPQIALYRHAVELFLKSGIIIIHRKLKMPYGRGERFQRQAAVSGPVRKLEVVVQDP